MVTLWERNDNRQSHHKRSDLAAGRGCGTAGASPESPSTTKATALWWRLLARVRPHVVHLALPWPAFEYRCIALSASGCPAVVVLQLVPRDRVADFSDERMVERTLALFDSAAACSGA
jgi:hypothetical protein